ncbi:MAG TPA: YggT family protein [Burkholderiales bacterium]|jgi:YggT family protein
MLTDIFQIIIRAVYWLLMPAALLRFYMQMRGMSFRGPLGQYVRAFTDWIVLPLRRVFKGAGYDWASLITAYVFELLYVFLMFAAAFHFALFTTPDGWLLWLVLALFGVVISAVAVMMVLLILYVVLSFLAPRDENQLGSQMVLLVTPWLAPIRRRVPLVGNLDLSPLILGVFLEIVYLLLANYLQPAVLALLH